jgi:hypothetical protein
MPLQFLLSPTKTLDFSPEKESKDGAKGLTAWTTPLMPAAAIDTISTTMQTQSMSALKKTLAVSDALANLNHKRYQSYQPYAQAQKQMEGDMPSGDASAFRRACFSYTGDSFKAMNVATLSQTEVLRLQDSLRILSGLFGVLRPLDRIQPYRLCMGDKLAVGACKHLYDYWTESVTDVLVADIKARQVTAIINVASDEYYKVVDGGRLVQALPEGKGIHKMVFLTAGSMPSVFAKQARGLLVRYAVTQDVQAVEELKGFDLEGYKFVASRSSEFEYVFDRAKPAPAIKVKAKVVAKAETEEGGDDQPVKVKGEKGKGKGKGKAEPKMKGEAQEKVAKTKAEPKPKAKTEKTEPNVKAEPKTKAVTKAKAEKSQKTEKVNAEKTEEAAAPVQTEKTVKAGKAKAEPKVKAGMPVNVKAEPKVPAAFSPAPYPSGKRARAVVNYTEAKGKGSDAEEEEGGEAENDESDSADEYSDEKEVLHPKKKAAKIAKRTPPAAPLVKQEESEGEEKTKAELFVIDVSPTNRAACKGCAEKFEKGEQRVGFMGFIAGRVAMKWHHPQCLMDKGYHDGLNLVLCPSARGACKQCGEKMGKGTVKVGFGTGEEKMWLDLTCAARALAGIVAGSGCTPKVITDFTGYTELSAADQALASAAITTDVTPVTAQTGGANTKVAPVHAPKAKGGKRNKEEGEGLEEVAAKPAKRARR